MRLSGLFAPPDAVEVIPGLHLGAAPSRRAARALTWSGVSYAIDLRTGGVRGSPWPESVQTFSCPLAEYEAPAPATLRAISRQIAALIAYGEIVYVHCRAGVQRAPTVACAVLMQMGWRLPDAFRLVGSRRSVAALSETQLKALKRTGATPVVARDPESPACVVEPISSFGPWLSAS